MNYDAIIRRAKRAIQSATDKIHGSKVHIVDQDADIKSLSGLVVIIADLTKDNTQNMTSDKISGS